MRPPRLIGAFFLISLAWTGAGLASDVVRVRKAAAAHAGMAAVADTLKLVNLHLQQVVNCLEGPGSEYFYAAAGNPCSQFNARAGESRGNPGAGAMAAISQDEREAIWTEMALTKQALSDGNVRKAKALAARIQLRLWDYKLATQ